MNLWIAVGLITFAVSVYLLRPLIRGGNAGVRRGDFDLSVYRRQLDELAADAERGVISGPEAEAARVEIQRRMIQTGRDAETAAQDGGNSRFIVGAIVAIALPAAAAALYMVLGSPNLPSQPLADRGAIPGRTQVAQAGGAEAAASQEGLASIEKMVESLSDKLEKDPTDFDGWMLLGRSYGVMEAYDKAVEAYARAAALPEGFGDANAQMQLGETIIFASQGVVTERAQGAFRRALEIDPGHPGAQFYLALAMGQAGNLRGAYEGWLALAAQSPADAPWMPALRARLEEVARDLEISLPDPLPTLPAAPAGAPPSAPVAAAPGSAPAPSAAAPSTPPAAGPIAGTRGPDAEQMRAAAEMSADDRQAMIRGMVQRLADRMADNPDDADGWNRLARAYGVLGDQEGAAEAYGNIVRLNPNDVQARLSLGGAYLAQVGPGPMPATAIEQFEAVLALDADNPDALWFLGRADAEAGRNDAAREKWQRLLGQLQPGSEAHDNVRAQIQRLDEG
ncbi:MULTISPECIES: c-type cytochrome biogenesis protein CcmI [unclassified Minwuia]|jgi:cytochrome c-type biogenesis protein CcmH|uniref:c-type cytochrome biogenesis protein CcmI n=1 Tax=unclassified Minwuia TaxID=2618799 RepID=UPI002478A173|nr:MULTISPECIES: c-type cytochrome biogenesis protein CcmI [unclassified Minwuia]